MPGAEHPRVSLQGVDKHSGELHVLRSIDLDVAAGEVVVVIGPSGSGTSTLSADRVVLMDAGSSVDVAPPEQFFAGGGSERTRSFLSAVLTH